MEPIQDERTITQLVDCRIIDGTGGPVIERGYVRIEGTRVVDVGAMPAPPVAGDNARLVGLSAATVLPGLMDMHVHLAMIVAERQGLEELAKLEPEPRLAIRALRDACDALTAGVTFIRTVAQARFVDVALKRAFEAGLYAGPRIFPSGNAITATGGHGHNVPGCVEADGPDQIRKSVRQQIRGGADNIKLIITGGIGTPGEQVDTPQLSQEEVSAGVQVAHWAGKPVAVHAGNSRSIAMAVEAGVDSVEHGYRIDEATADLMAERGTFLVPTLIVTRDPEYTQDPARPEWWREKVRRAADEHLRSFERARRAGVRVCLGSDAPGVAKYAIRELEALVAAGMSPIEAIQSATQRGAELARQSELGTIQRGKLADLLVVDGDPSRRIGDVHHVRLVFKAGAVVVDREQNPPGSSSTCIRSRSQQVTHEG